MTITEIAKRLGVSRQSIDALMNQRRSLSPEMAKRIELAFGGSAELLLSLQMKYDLAKVEDRVSDFTEQLEPFEHKS
jgi:addiction module HigA family antidote